MSILFLACTERAFLAAPPIADDGTPQIPESDLAERVGFSGAEGLRRFDRRTGTATFVPNAEVSANPETNPPPPPYEIGADDDSIVSDPSAFPYSAAVKLYMSWGDDVWVCSGTLVAAATVLTAGHCMYDATNGREWADRIEVVPALDGDDRPFESAWAVTFTTYTTWTDDGDFAGDMGFLSLDRSVGLHAGFLDREYDDDAGYYVGTALNMNSYPSAEWGDGSTMYHAFDAVIDADEDIVYHELDTTGGTSGGGMYRYEKSTGSRYVRANNSFQTTDGSGSPLYNGGVRFTSQRWADLSTFLTDVDDADDRADLRDEASSLSDGSVATGSTLSIQASIANRGTATATDVDVAYALSTDSTWSDDDATLGAATCAQVAAFGTCSGSLSFALPDEVGSGRWKVLQRIDDADAIAEYDETDNLTVLGSITVDRDLDGDGFDDVAFGGEDCDDADDDVNPSAEEVCDNGIDEDCSGRDGTCPEERTREEDDSEDGGEPGEAGPSSRNDGDDDDDDGSGCHSAPGSVVGGWATLILLIPLARRRR